MQLSVYFRSLRIPNPKVQCSMPFHRLKAIDKNQNLYRRNQTVSIGNLLNLKIEKSQYWRQFLACSAYQESNFLIKNMNYYVKCSLIFGKLSIDDVKKIRAASSYGRKASFQKDKKSKLMAYFGISLIQRSYAKIEIHIVIVNYFLQV